MESVKLIESFNSFSLSNYPMASEDGEQKKRDQKVDAISRSILESPTDIKPTYPAMEDNAQYEDEETSVDPSQKIFPDKQRWEEGLGPSEREYHQNEKMRTRGLPIVKPFKREKSEEPAPDSMCTSSPQSLFGIKKEFFTVGYPNLFKLSDTMSSDISEREENERTFKNEKPEEQASAPMRKSGSKSQLDIAAWLKDDAFTRYYADTFKLPDAKLSVIKEDNIYCKDEEIFKRNNSKEPAPDLDRICSPQSKSGIVEGSPELFLKEDTFTAGYPYTFKLTAKKSPDNVKRDKIYYEDGEAFVELPQKASLKRKRYREGPGPVKQESYQGKRLRTGESSLANRFKIEKSEEQVPPMFASSLKTSIDSASFNRSFTDVFIGSALHLEMKRLYEMVQEGTVDSIYPQKENRIDIIQGQYECNCYWFFDHGLKMAAFRIHSALHAAMYRLKEVPPSHDGVPSPFNIAMILKEKDLPFWKLIPSLEDVKVGDVLIYFPRGYKQLPDPPEDSQEASGTHIMVVNKVHEKRGSTFNFTIIDSTRVAHSDKDSRHPSKSGIGLAPIYIIPQERGFLIQWKPEGKAWLKEVVIGRFQIVSSDRGVFSASI